MGEVDLRKGMMAGVTSVFCGRRDGDRAQDRVEESLARRVLGVGAGFEDLKGHDGSRLGLFPALVAGRTA